MEVFNPMGLKRKLLSLIFLSFLLISVVFAFSGFGYPTSSTGEKTTPITVKLGATGIAKGHLGEDYLMPEGAPIYAIADGVVFKIANWPACPGSQSHGWGGVVLIEHQIPENIDKTFDTKNAILPGSPAISNPKVVYSLYGHLKNIQVQEGQR